MRIRTISLMALLALAALIGMGMLSPVSAQAGYYRAVVYQFDVNAMPYSIAIDAAGNYVVGEGGTIFTDRNSRISRITPAGAYTLVYTSSLSPSDSQIYDLAIDGDGNYVVAESWQQTVTKIDAATGSRLVSLNLNPLFGSYIGPFGIAVDSDAGYLVAVADQSIYQAVWKIASLSGTAYTELYTVDNAHRGPYDIAVDGAGDYIVTESGSSYGGGAGALVKISRSLNSQGGHDRTLIYQFAAGTTPFGVAIDRDGSYLVVEHASGILSRITQAGARSVVYQFAPATCPTRVAVDRAGSYIVAEGCTNVLSKISHTVFLPLIIR